jgi:hypothetical protein
MEILHLERLSVLHAIRSGYTILSMTLLLTRKIQMDEFELNPEQGFIINYQRIVDEKSLLSITRLLAIDMMKNPYIRVGDFLKNLSDIDLNVMLDIIDAGEEHENFSDLILIAEMLATGEGLEQGSLDVVHSRINQFLTLITCESLYRRGMIKVHHENMSFGDDMANAIVASKL